jgi:uncharacterized damage-inducible protein DinB
MVLTVTDDRWAATRRYLRRTGDRFAALVSPASDSGTRATVHWSVAETAAHVLTLAPVYRAMVDPDDTAAPFPDLGELVDATTVDAFNAALLAQYCRSTAATCELSVFHQEDNSGMAFSNKEGVGRHG